MKEYHAAEGLSNHALQIFKNDPASYIWSKTAPQDPSKVNASDIGTATHTALLEPHLLDDEVVVSGFKGRATGGFIKDQADNPDKIVLTEVEMEKVKVMALSATCHPTFNEHLGADGICEASIFVTCPETGIKLKIRPDKIVDTFRGEQVFILDDVKTTANIEDWRSEQHWKNPLTNFGYGFTAAFYLYAASIYFKEELQEYNFLIVQTTANMGRYPVGVFTISRQELIDMGFWDDMLATLRYFKFVSDSGEWATVEHFPSLGLGSGDEGEIEVTYE